MIGPLAGATLTDAGVGSLFQNLILDLSEWLPLIGGVVVGDDAAPESRRHRPRAAGKRAPDPRSPACSDPRPREWQRKPISFTVPDQTTKVRTRVAPRR